MPNEISTINATSNLSSQVRKTANTGAEGQQAVTSGKTLPSEQARAAESAATVAAQAKDIKQAVSDINAYVQTVNRELQFSVEEELPLGRAVIRVIDADTDEVIREIPSKEVLQIARRLDELNESNSAGEEVKGLIIQAQA